MATRAHICLFWCVFSIIYSALIIHGCRHMFCVECRHMTCNRSNTSFDKIMRRHSCCPDMNSRKNPQFLVFPIEFLYHFFSNTSNFKYEQLLGKPEIKFSVRLPFAIAACLFVSVMETGGGGVVSWAMFFGLS